MRGVTGPVSQSADVNEHPVSEIQDKPNFFVALRHQKISPCCLTAENHVALLPRTFPLRKVPDRMEAIGDSSCTACCSLIPSSRSKSAARIGRRRIKSATPASRNSQENDIIRPAISELSANPQPTDGIGQGQKAKPLWAARRVGKRRVSIRNQNLYRPHSRHRFPSQRLR